MGIGDCGVRSGASSVRKAGGRRRSSDSPYGKYGSSTKGAAHIQPGAQPSVLPTFQSSPYGERRILAHGEALAEPWVIDLTNGPSPVGWAMPTNLAGVGTA